MNSHVHEIFAGYLDAVSKSSPKVECTALSKPDLSFEQSGPLNADAVNLKALIDHVDVLLGAAYAALGKGITKPATNALDDFHGGLSDLRSDLQGMYDRYDAEIESRDAVLEREHERAETAMVRR